MSETPLASVAPGEVGGQGPGRSPHPHRPGHGAATSGRRRISRRHRRGDDPPGWNATRPPNAEAGAPPWGASAPAAGAGASFLWPDRGLSGPRGSQWRVALPARAGGSGPDRRPAEIGGLRQRGSPDNPPNRGSRRRAGPTRRPLGEPAPRCVPRGTPAPPDAPGPHARPAPGAGRSEGLGLCHWKSTRQSACTEVSDAQLARHSRAQGRPPRPARSRHRVDLPPPWGHPRRGPRPTPPGAMARRGPRCVRRGRHRTAAARGEVRSKRATEEETGPK